MTEMKPATCPKCLSTKPAIFIRDGAWSTGVDNLVCKSCHGEKSHSLPVAGLVSK